MKILLKNMIIISLIIGNVFAIQPAKVIFSQEKLKTIPIERNLLSSDNGGEIAAVDAYSDGVGIITLTEPHLTFDNSAMNTLVYEYGDSAKTEDVSLKEYITNNSTEENVLNLASNLGGISEMKIDGTPCDDNNDGTYNDQYIKNVCKGIPNTVIGAFCNDNNPGTFNDIYVSTNGICLGTLNTVIGEACNDNNTSTYNDKYINITGGCIGTSYVNKVNKTYYSNGSIGANYTSTVKDYTSKVSTTIPANKSYIPCTIGSSYFGVSSSYTVHVNGGSYSAGNTCVYGSLSTSYCPNTYGQTMSSTPGGHCTATVGTSSQKFNYTCPSGYTLSGSNCTGLQCPTGYIYNGTKCEKNINYYHYKYVCPSGYNILNQGYLTGTKVDPNTSAINNELSNPLNSSTPPTNNCWKTQLECPTGYYFDGQGCRI